MSEFLASLPCHYCEELGSVWAIDADEDGGEWLIECETCGMTGPTNCESMGDAISKWLLIRIRIKDKAKVSPES